MKMKTTLVLAFVLGLPLLLCAQSGEPYERRTFPLVESRIVDSASYTYCSSPERPTQQPLKIKTSGSSTTVVSNTASTGALKGIAIGDVLDIVYAGRIYRRYVTAAASANSITVNSGIILTDGASYRYWRPVCGTGAEDGWFGVESGIKLNVTYTLGALDATSMDVKLECRPFTAVSTPVTQDVENKTAAGSWGIFDEVLYDECRVGHKANTLGTTTTFTAYVNLSR